MTGNSGLKRQIRARMKHTGEPYSVARRAIQNPEVAMSQEELERLFADIDEYRSEGWGRIMVPHGYTVKSISDGTVIVEMPVIWEPRRNTIRAMASDMPATANLDELRALIERGLDSRKYLPNAQLAKWEPVMDDGPRPGNLNWTVKVRVSG